MQSAYECKCLGSRVVPLGMVKRAPRIRLIIHASAGRKSTKEEVAAREGKVDRVIEELKKSGMTAAKAKQVLKAWSEVGVKDSDALRKVMVNKSLAPVPGITLQAVLDGVACMGSFWVADMAEQSTSPFKAGVEVLGDVMGVYYLALVVLHLAVIGGLLYTSLNYGTNSSELLRAVTKMAGPPSGVGLVDQANRVVNVIAVMNALESVAAMLRKKYGDSAPSSSRKAVRGESLHSLGAYLTLAQAREQYGFRPEHYGLTEHQAGAIACAFSEADTNQNFRLEPAELARLCNKLGRQLSEEEVVAAVRILDKDGNGWIDFPEFVQWWVDRSNEDGAS